MRHPWRRFGACAAMCVLGACSSGSGKAAPTSTRAAVTTSAGPTTSTTPAVPNAATVAAVRSFFASDDGKTITKFLRASAPFVTGRLPSKATCRHYANDVLPKVQPDPAEMLNLVSTTPDTRLVRLLRYDVSTKFYMLSVCTNRPIPAKAATLLLANWKRLDARLKLEGISY